MEIENRKNPLIASDTVNQLPLLGKVHVQQDMVWVATQYKNGEPTFGMKVGAQMGVVGRLRQKITQKAMPKVETTCEKFKIFSVIFSNKALVMNEF